MLTVDLSQLPADVRSKVDEIVRGDYDLQVKRAVEVQKRAAAHFYRNPPKAGPMGRQVMAIHPTLHAMWSQARGAQTWDDPDWVKYFLKHSPECAVRSQPARLVLQVPGLAGSGSRAFRKVYS